MPGNRERERAFQIPLLMELAARYEPAKSGRGRRREDLADVRSNVLEFFSFSKIQRAKTRPNKKTGKPYIILDNEVDIAFDQLVKMGQATRKNGTTDRHGRRLELCQWEITERGFKRIRKFLQDHIAYAVEDAPQELDRLLHLRNGSGPEFLLLLMKCVDSEKLPKVIARTENLVDLLIEGLKNTTDEGLRTLLVDFWEVIRDEFYEVHREHFRKALSQV